MHSPRPVSAENTLRGRAAAALYHNPARMCQKASIRTDRKGERTRIRANRTAKPQSHTPERRCVVKSQAELVRLLSQWCVYFRALRKFYNLSDLQNGRRYANENCLLSFKLNSSNPVLGSDNNGSSQFVMPTLLSWIKYSPKQTKPQW